jgi:hypothetical protein
MLRSFQQLSVDVVDALDILIEKEKRKYEILAYPTRQVQYTSESRTCPKGRMVVSDTKKVRLSNAKNKMADLD